MVSSNSSSALVLNIVMLDEDPELREMAKAIAKQNLGRVFFTPTRRPWRDACGGLSPLEARGDPPLGGMGDDDHQHAGIVERPPIMSSV